MVKPSSSLAPASLVGLLLLLVGCSNDTEAFGHRGQVDCPTLYRLPGSPEVACIPPAADETSEEPAELERVEKEVQGVRIRLLPAR
jgi:hypothetical protein